MQIILASRSPRRKELLQKIINEFIIHPSSVNEEEIKEKDPRQFAISAAILKSKDVAEKFPEAIVIAADTVVAFEDQIFGKPKSLEEAKIMLKALSGSRHKVITGIALYKKNEEKLLTGYELTYVIFKDLSDQEIDDYLKNNDFHDKAGSYAVQQIGDKFIEDIKGDYENVVGFPTKRVKKLLADFFAPQISLKIIDIALPNNWGVGKYEKFTVFVPGSVIGDIVKVKILRKKKNFSYAQIVEIEKPSPFRQEAPCPHFGPCGGCIFQNFLYEKQLALKENYLKQTLSRIGNIDLKKVKIEPIISSPDIYFYRTKMEFAFGEKEGGIILGLRERSSPIKNYNKKVVPLEKCLIFSPLVEKIFPIFIDWAKENKFSAFDPRTKKGILRHLVLRETKNTKELMVILVTIKREITNLDKFGEKLLKDIPQIKSFYGVTNTRLADVVAYEKESLILGKSYLEEKMGDLKFRIYPQTFFQSNTKAAQILYHKIIEFSELKKNKNILGLYCGSGPIEIFLSHAAKEVMGIDASPINIANAQENCKINKIENGHFFAGEVEKLLKDTFFENIYQLILDPPRNGLSPQALKLILKWKVPQITYVSCNPATLARDLKVLQENSYRVKKVAPFDFFPHAAHLETVTVLESI